MPKVQEKPIPPRYFVICPLNNKRKQKFSLVESLFGFDKIVNERKRSKDFQFAEQIN